MRWELGVTQPLVPMRLFADIGFAVDNAVLFLLAFSACRVGEAAAHEPAAAGTAAAPVA